jgi:signal transduction histidine kinase
MSGERILVVEDHKALLDAIQEVLESNDYVVLFATNSLEALQVMEETRPDLIIADIMMPMMDGYALYEAVRSRSEWVAIPFIFLTAKSAKEDILKGKILGVEDYTKPFEPQELLAAVRARLARAWAICEAAAAEFDHLKQQIVTILGHELRTPLTYIHGYTALALEDIPSLSREALEEFLLAIKRGADRLTTLVEDLLLIVRLDAGETSKEFRSLVQVRKDLAAIVRRTVSRHEERATANSLTLETDVAPDLPAVQLCEPLFADALDRLVDNAIKFSHGRGKRVLVSARPANGGVEIAVQDWGIGIPANEIPHLFERFRQINCEKLEQRGVGLGLAIAKELIQLHGGEITVESKVNEGSTFTIRLPTIQEDQGA